MAFQLFIYLFLEKILTPVLQILSRLENISTVNGNEVRLN